MSPEDPVTVGELGRRIAGLESRMEAGFARIETRVGDLGYVSRERYEAEHRAQNDDIKALRHLTWSIFSMLAASLLSVGMVILAKVVSA